MPSFGFEPTRKNTLAVSPPLVSEILSAPPTFLRQKTYCLCLSVCAVAVDLKASKRTKNFTGKW